MAERSAGREPGSASASGKRAPHAGFPILRYTVVSIGLSVVMIALGLFGAKTLIDWYYSVSSEEAGYADPAPGLVETSFDGDQLRVYFTAGDGSLRAQSIPARGAATEYQRARRVALALIEGPTDGHLLPPLPDDIELLGLYLNNDVVVVDLGGAGARNFNGSTRDALVAVFALVNSLLRNLENHRAALLLVEGRRASAWADVDLSQPLRDNPGLVR